MPTPVNLCPGCGVLFVLDSVPGNPHRKCQVCGWPFDPASAEVTYFDTTDKVQPDKAREPMREQHRADARLAQQVVGVLGDVKEPKPEKASK